MRRTVITGIGIWSCIGQSIQEVEQSLRLGKSGIGIDPERTAYGDQSPLTGIVPRPDIKAQGLRRSQRITLSEPGEYGYMAMKEALTMAPVSDLYRCGLIVSNDSTAGALAETEAIMAEYHDSRRLGAGMVFRTLNSSVSMSLASIFGIGGLTLSVSAACAGGGHAIGLAHSLIQSGQLDCCIVVGAQEVGLHAYTSFDALGLFSKRTDNPAAASRPFDTERDGLVPSGGAACVILETAGHAAMGNRKPLATVDGYGFSTSPDLVSPSADAIYQSMTAALSAATVPSGSPLGPGSVCGDGIATPSLSAIMAHATSTPDGDRAEAEAIHRFCLDKGLSHPFVISTKALTGHECWMSGVSQIVYALIQMQGGFIAPNINLRTIDPAAATLRIPTAPTVTTLTTVLCNAFGFGGTNSSLVISRAG
jgi:3-oxoacyl-[acyl-carrier-protein] synthase-1